jgi:hypothetical protein
VWVFGLRANNFSSIKSELSIVSIAKLYKVTPVHLGYHFQYLHILYSCKQGRGNLVPRAFPFLSLGRREKALAPGGHMTFNTQI